MTVLKKVLLLERLIGILQRTMFFLNMEITKFKSYQMRTRVYNTRTYISHLLSERSKVTRHDTIYE